MEEVDPIAGLSLAMGMFLMVLQQHGVIDGLDSDSRSLLLCAIMTGCASIVNLLLTKEGRLIRSRAVVAAITKVVYEEFYEQQNIKRRHVSSDGNNSNRKKRRPTRHDHARAWMCIQADYLGPSPIFTDKQFEEVFRLTKSAIEKLINACCRHEPKYFLPGKDAVGKPGIRVECKVLGILKCIAFGCSGVAFRDYHQMARNTFSESLKAFFRAILADSRLRETYLRVPTAADCRRIAELHLKQHGVAGMLYSLDCMHALWKNCPIGQQCHFKNAKKNKMSSVVIEAAVDYNTWFWHTSCGHPGTNNDINIWDVSDLQKKFLSPEWCNEVNFPFEVDGMEFTEGWVLVDGIYPPISRFVKTIPTAVGAAMELFIKWQESCRKDSERAFGVLVRKFQCLATPNEYWFIEDVKNQMYGCVLMHNMMVEVRIQRDEREEANMYALDASQEETVGEFQETSHSSREDKLNDYIGRHLGLNPPAEYYQQQIEIQAKRWASLHSEEAHIKLQTAVMNQVASNYINRKGTAMVEDAMVED